MTTVKDSTMFLRQALKLSVGTSRRHSRRVFWPVSRRTAGICNASCAFKPESISSLMSRRFVSVLNFSTAIADKTEATIDTSREPTDSAGTKWSLAELEDETSRLKSLLVNDNDRNNLNEDIHVNLTEFDEIFEAWSSHAKAKGGMSAADTASDLLDALEKNMSRLAIGSTFLKWNVAWYNNVMHAYAVCSGGRQAAEKAEAILNKMLIACREHRPRDGSIAPPEPTTRSFNVVINAWAKSNERDSGERAEDIFTKMETWRVECERRPDYEGAVPNARSLSGVLDAWAQSSVREAAERASRVLMFAVEKQRAAVKAKRDGEPAVEDVVIKPNVIMFNSAIHAWVNSNRGQEGAEQAERLLCIMERLDESGELDEIDEKDIDDVGLKPNTRTLSLVVDAWARCENKDKTGGAAKRAQDILDQMERLYREGKDVKPSYITFTSCIAAWARSERNADAAENANELLERLLHLYDETGDEDFHPTSATFNAVISAFANSNLEDSEKRAEGVFSLMDAYCEADTYSYNCLINAHAKKGHFMTARNLLEDMEIACSKGDTSACPDLVTYNTVIYALSKSSRLGNAEEAEKLLEKMKKLYSEGKANLKPTPTTYTAVMTAWGRSKHPKQAEYANRMLKAMIKAYEAGDMSLRPDVKAFTTAINVCARTVVQDSDHARSVLKIAIKAFEEMKRNPKYDNPNSVTYRALMIACRRLAADPAERFRLMQSIFCQCCQEGMATKLILATLRDGLSDDELGTLVGNGRPYPSEWSRNVSRWDRP